MFSAVASVNFLGSVWFGSKLSFLIKCLVNVDSFHTCFSILVI